MLEKKDEIGKEIAFNAKIEDYLTERSHIFALAIAIPAITVDGISTCTGFAFYACRQDQTATSGKGSADTPSCARI